MRYTILLFAAGPLDGQDKADPAKQLASMTWLSPEIQTFMQYAGYGERVMLEASRCYFHRGNAANSSEGIAS